MPAPNILVIAVDGLRASALGAYGNTTFATPALDELAAESLVCDWCFGEAVDLPTIYRGLWQSSPPLIGTLAQRGYETTLVSDDASIADFEGGDHFQRRTVLPTLEPKRAEDAADTAIGRVFAAAGESLQCDAGGPQLVWIHSRGMYGPWDAPLELQEELLARDEGDPPPEDIVEPPDHWLDDASNPDAAFLWSCAYAAQVMALDACLAGLLQTLDALDGNEWLVVLLGLRGLPLGEHRRVGGVDGRLHAEQLQVPLLWRLPNAGAKLARKSQLVSLSDVPAGLFGALEGRLPDVDRDALQSVGPAGERAIRTADWTLCCGPSGNDTSIDEESTCQLFVRPDDRWEANDVAALCPEVVETLLARIGGSPTR